MTPIQDGNLQLTGVAQEQRVLFERVVEQQAEKYTQGAPAPSPPALYRHSGMIAAQDKPQPAAGRPGSAGIGQAGLHITNLWQGTASPLSQHSSNQFSSSSGKRAAGWDRAVPLDMRVVPGFLEAF